MKKNIIICILVILVLGLCGYLVYDKLNDKKESTNTAVESNDTEIEHSNLNDELAVRQLLDSVSISTCGGGYRYEIDNGDVLKYDSLSNDERFSLAYKSFFGKNSNVVLSKSIMLKAYNNFFGDGQYTLPETVEMIGNFGGVIKLSNDEYVADTPAIGSCVGRQKYILTGFNMLENKITIDVILVVIEYDAVEEPEKVYIMEPGSINDTRIQANERYERRIEITANDLTDEKILDAIASTKSNFVQFRFTFNAQKDRYTFDNVERIN